MNSTTKSHMNIKTKWNVVKEHSEQHRFITSTPKRLYVKYLIVLHKILIICSYKSQLFKAHIITIRQSTLKYVVLVTNKQPFKKQCDFVGQNYM